MKLTFSRLFFVGPPIFQSWGHGAFAGPNRKSLPTSEDAGFDRHEFVEFAGRCEGFGSCPLFSMWKFVIILGNKKWIYRTIGGWHVDFEECLG